MIASLDGTRHFLACLPTDWHRSCAYNGEVAFVSVAVRAWLVASSQNDTEEEAEKEGGVASLDHLD